MKIKKRSPEQFGHIIMRELNTSFLLYLATIADALFLPFVNGFLIVAIGAIFLSIAFLLLRLAEKAQATMNSYYL